MNNPIAKVVWDTHEEVSGEPFHLAVMEERGQLRYIEHGHKGMVEFMIFQRGPMQHYINGQRREENRGDIVLLRPTEDHWFRGRDILYTNLAFPLNWLKELERLWQAPGFPQSVLEATEVPRCHLKEEPLRHLEHLLARLLIARRGPEARQQFVRLLHELFCEGMRIPLWGNPTNAPMPDWLTELLAWVDAEWVPELRTGDLYQHAYRSREHVSRVFQQCLKMSPSQYLNGKRLDRGAALLANTNYPVSDVAESVGFENLSHFCRLFRDEYGETPRAYRKRHLIQIG